MAEECAQFGWTALAKMLGKSKRTLMRQKSEMKAFGAILYTKKRSKSGYVYDAMYFFPSIIKAYLIKKSIE